MISLTPTGEQKKFIKAFRSAAEVLILARIADDWEYLTLDYLCSTLGAKDPASRNSVLWAVQRAKDEGILAKTGRRSVYEIIR
tara:strand:+ start:617 stop:865 length:249 start_codon:yes stop_codon:yes gene_type:complete